jgi:hypothetical protein
VLQVASPPSHPNADFKRQNTPEVWKALAPLLKAYQEEVDRLTNR